MDSIVDLILLIRERLAVYITRHSISCLKVFIDGWVFRMPATVDHSFDSFQQWVEEKYRIKSSHSWCDIILFYSQDESSALDNFFQEFDKWRNEKEQNV